MVGILEKVVWVLTILSIVFVAFLLWSRSDISAEQVIDLTNAANPEGLPWADPGSSFDQYYVQAPKTAPVDGSTPGGAEAKQPAAGGQQPGRTDRPAGQNQPPPVHIDRKTGRTMPPHLIAGEWQGNTFVVPPVNVHSSFQEKYSHKQDVLELLNTAYATYEEFEDGRIEVTMHDMDGSSPFKRILGLQPGDKIVSVNGQSISGGISGAWNMYETMKTLGNYELEVVRAGERVRFQYNITR